MKKIKEVTTQSFAGKRAILVCFKEKSLRETEENVKELELLTLTLRLKIIKKFIFPLNTIHPSTFIGKGKVTVLKEFIEKEKIFVMIFEKDLTPIQQRNLEEILKVRVIDRTGLILHIFGEHAKSKEGKIQVELAHLSYLLPRLTGYGISLSRLGGGLGTRGPGEMKLEVYRRRIKERIHKLKQKIKEIEKHRELIRSSRRRKNFPFVSLLGYTNVGKSSLLNKMSSAKLYVADKLFSTLDPATRAVYLGDDKICLVSDTVGLLQNIPHHLIEAFKSTLEETTYADLILCVYDASSSNLEKQKATVLEVLEILGIENKPCLTVFNKIDLLSPEEINILKGKYPEGIFVSAITGEGIEELKNSIKEILYGVEVKP
ncbi:GTPase HflX [bacterium]|nr:GTPase HflX [bacterium]